MCAWWKTIKDFKFLWMTLRHTHTHTHIHGHCRHLILGIQYSLLVAYWAENWCTLFTVLNYTLESEAAMRPRRCQYVQMSVWLYVCARTLCCVRSFLWLFYANLFALLRICYKWHARSGTEWCVTMRMCVSVAAAAAVPLMYERIHIEDAISAAIRLLTPRQASNGKYICTVTCKIFAVCWTIRSCGGKSKIFYFQLFIKLN